MTEKKQEKKREKICVLLTDPKRTEKGVEEAARILAHRHAGQLERLEEEGKKVLAESAVVRFLKYVEAGLLREAEPLEIQVLEAVNYNEKIPQSRGFFFNKIRLVTKDSKEDKKWTEEGVFRRTGIETPEGAYYIKDGTKHHKYGYRKGTHAEAVHNGYQRVEDMRT